jgi:hypothetical protein
LILVLVWNPIANPYPLVKVVKGKIKTEIGGYK